jgi:tetratricopeptide (TPR) repeat protein
MYNKKITRHCGLDPQSPCLKEMLKHVRYDGRYFLFAVLLCFPFAGKSQQAAPNLLQSAVYWEAQGELQSAAYLYQEYLTENPDAPAGIYYKCASLLLNLYHYTQSQTYFRKIVDSDSLDFYPQSLFWLGMALKN